MPLSKKERRMIKRAAVRGKRKNGLIGRALRAKRSGVPEYASLSVKRSMAGNIAPNNNFGLQQLYSLMNTSLDQFPRAVQVAQAYQHYRIKKISVTFKPSYDTFVATAGAPTKTRLYWMIDKSGAVPTNIALEGLKAMGARPREVDEKPITVAWAPSVLEATMVAPPASIPSKYRISPWLATNQQPLQAGVFAPSTVDHLGLYWYLDSINNPEGYQYQVEVEVQFQFKKPLTNILAAVEAVPATFAVINNSPDGIVGGGDDHLAT